MAKKNKKRQHSRTVDIKRQMEQEKLAEEKDTLNGALVEALGAVLGKTEQLSKAKPEAEAGGP